MDPSDAPKNRRLDRETFSALLEERASRRSDADREFAYERLTWFMNRLLEASLSTLPREHRRAWTGSVAVDATVVPSHARPERRGGSRKKKWADRPILRHSTDPDAGYYVRRADDRDEDGAPEHIRKGIWGNEATLVVSGSVPELGEEPFPALVVAMAPLHKPGQEPGKNAIRALRNLVHRGHPVGYLAADNNYSAARPEDYHQPGRDMGYKLALSYRSDQLGIQAESNGLVMVEGRWYCNSMPQVLVDATKDFWDGRITKEEYGTRIAVRRLYEARPKGKPDADGC